MFSVWIPPQGFEPWTHGLRVQTWRFMKPLETNFASPVSIICYAISPERFGTCDDLFHCPYRAISHRSHVSKRGTSPVNDRGRHLTGHLGMLMNQHNLGLLRSENRLSLYKILHCSSLPKASFVKREDLNKFSSNVKIYSEPCNVSSIRGTS